MEYGHFSSDDKEYVIIRPDTPTPWINYLSNSEYCAIISNTAGGYSFHIDPRDRRILRYRYNNLPIDRPGRYLYIRDNKTKRYWSPTWQPTLTDLSEYECRHGLGYTKISSSYSGIKAEVTYFVPLDKNLEIWILTLKNISPEEKDEWAYTPLKSHADMSALRSLPKAEIESSFNLIESGNNNKINIILTNTSNNLAFFLRTIIVDEKTEQFIAPVYWDNNCISLLPSEKVEVKGVFPKKAISGKAIVKIVSWNC